jgi:hypothetical protein
MQRTEILETPTNKDRAVTAALSLRNYAAGEWPLLNHKGRLRALSKLLPHWSERRVRAVYNAEQGVALRAAEQADIDALAEEENRNEFQALEARLARLEAALFASDEEFHQPQVDAFRAAVDGRRGRDVPDASRSGEA